MSINKRSWKYASTIERERKAHHLALEQLARYLNPANTKSGLQLWRALRRIETQARAAANQYCDDGDLAAFEKVEAIATVAVQKLFGKLPPRFFVNSDARGHVLKLASNDDGSQTATPFDLAQDWGRNQILAPEIN